MNAKIGLLACPTVEHAVKASVLSDVYWISSAADGISSKVSCLQFYSDRLQNSLRARAIVYYTFHDAFPTFSKE